MFFFTVELNFEGDLYSTYVVKVYFVGIKILGQRDRAMKKMSKTTLKVKWRLGAVPQAYELRITKILFS